MKIPQALTMKYQCATMNLVHALLNLVDIAAYFQVNVNLFSTHSLVNFIPSALRFTTKKI